MSEPVVSLERLHVVHTARGGGMRRERVYALTDVTASVRRGEVLGVVGESGCGKSTLAKVMVGLQVPASGTVRFRGDDLWSMPTKARRESFGTSVGVVFQDAATALNPRLPVGRILRDPLDVHRRGTVPRREARVLELLGLVGLPAEVAGTLPGRLSGGQRQRVAVARALALEPEVIVADEPTSALDVSVRAQVLNLLGDLRANLGLGLVLISHDIQTVRHLADRIAVMYLGRMVEEGPAGEVSSRPRHPLHARSVLGHPEPARRHRAADRAGRSGAVGDASPVRLPVPHPLLEGRRRVRDSIPAGRLGGPALLALFSPRTPDKEHSVSPRKSRFSGVVPPPVTPLTPDGEVDVPSLERLVEFLIEATTTRVVERAKITAKIGADETAVVAARLGEAGPR